MRTLAYLAIAIFLCLSTFGIYLAIQSSFRLNRQLEEIRTAFEPWREEHTRVAFRPVTKLSRDPFQLSKFGGTPHLQEGETWPKCGSCDEPMHLFLQLDLAALPERRFPDDAGLFQLFYCTRMAPYVGLEEDVLMEVYSVRSRDELLRRMATPPSDEILKKLLALQEAQAETRGFDCDDFEAFSPCHLLRVIPSERLFAQQPLAEKVFQQVDIIGWDSIDDHPSSTEMDELGLRFDVVSQPGLTTTSVHWDERGLQFSDITIPNDADHDVWTAISPPSATGDKLYGWPNWIQWVEYPDCRICGTRMVYFFQLDSEDNLPYMFGDVGCGHVTYCPVHPDVFAFQWACH